MVSVSPANPTGMTLRTVVPPLTNPTLTTQTINGLPFFDFAPNAPALGSTVDINTGDIRLVNACYVNGSIWAAHAVESGGRAAARWYEVDPVGLSLVQTGLVADPVLSYYYPSIAADANGSVVMGFSGSDATSFPSAYYRAGPRWTPPVRWDRRCFSLRAKRLIRSPMVLAAIAGATTA